MEHDCIREGIEPARETGSPASLLYDAAQFNVFRLSYDDNTMADCRPYSRKGLYKISLLYGHTKLLYADKTLEFEKCALLFSNPNIPYSWEHCGDKYSSFFCVFTEAFFDQFGRIRDYPVFKPGNMPLFDLSDEQYEAFSRIFTKMQQEIASDFSFKYDVLRTQVLELIHDSLRLQPSVARQYNDSNGAHRIASLFTELLERQFPIASPLQRMELRYPVEFAAQLSIHVNHLNRSLKEIHGQTTSRLIAGRIMQEARGLLKHTDWNISEIAWCLGFEELPHFINFFRTNEQCTPKSYRKLQVV